MKLLVGNPGNIDGWIPPPKVVNVPVDQINDIFGETADQKSYNADMDNLCNDIPIRLFNLTADPYETNNIAGDNPDVVKELAERLEQFRKTMVPPDITKDVKEGNPNLHGGFFGPGWCQSEPLR